jgi:hypothetical protein
MTPAALYSIYPSDLRPQVYCLRTKFAMMAGGDVMAGDVEQVGNWIMDRDEAL